MFARNKYAGIRNLYTEREGFDENVMKPEEIKNFFKENEKYTAPFAYPCSVANGFGKVPVFSGHEIHDDRFDLKAKLQKNTKPADCMTLVASLFLPKKFTATDEIKFVTDVENGFGEGTCRVTSKDCRDEDGKEAKLTKLLIGVKDRPALFLKVAKAGGGFYDNIAIFFPAQVGTLSHFPVRNGEVFVLVKKDVELTVEDLNNIQQSFVNLVQPSYGNQGLYAIHDHRPLTDVIAERQAPQANTLH